MPPGDGASLTAARSTRSRLCTCCHARAASCMSDCPRTGAPRPSPVLHRPTVHRHRRRRSLQPSMDPSRRLRPVEPKRSRPRPRTEAGRTRARRPCSSRDGGRPASRAVQREADEPPRRSKTARRRIAIAPRRPFGARSCRHRDDPDGRSAGACFQAEAWRQGPDLEWTFQGGHSAPERSSPCISCPTSPCVRTASAMEPARSVFRTSTRWLTGPDTSARSRP